MTGGMMRNLDGNALLIDGHLGRDDARAQARAFMLAADMDEMAVDDLLVDRPHLIARAWWSDEHGFCCEPHQSDNPRDDNTHFNQRPVTVVHVEVPA
jgi:hypothetical protein